MSRGGPGSVPASSRSEPLLSAEGWVAFLASLLSRLYLGVLLSLALIAVLPASLGWHGTVVQSGSMEPHITAGDVVLAASPEAGAPVPVGGVVEYTSPASAEPSGVDRTRLHRVVAENTDGTFVTAGDANTDVDSTPLAREQITGQARLLVPMIGLPGLWLGTANLPALASWTVLTLLAVVLALLGRPAGTPDEEDDEGRRDCRTGGRTELLRVGSGLGLVAVMVGLVTTPAPSTAAFTARAATTANTFGAAADWTPPAARMIGPGPSINGSTTLTAEASDAESGVRSITLQYLPPGGTSWLALCTATTAPYSCAWDTRGVPDGSYRLRAIATNGIGLSTTSTEATTTVANAFTLTLSNPGEVQRGVVDLTVSPSGSGAAGYAIRVEYSLSGTDRWSALCTNLTAPYNCPWDTVGLANDYYDLRAVAVSGSAITSSATVADVLVDNLGPVVTMNDPGTPLSGTRTFSATATDAHSGVARTQVQVNRAGTSTWTPLCTIDAIPFSCRFDTTVLANGTYNVRAVATDAAGTSTVSAVVANRLVDNTIASVSLEDPGTHLTGTARLSASANTTAGISRVRIETAPGGTTSWTTRCTLATAPFSCDWDTRTTTDGLYDLRAVLTDTAGRETVSAVVAARRVDNSPLRGTDVQTTNGSGTPGLLDAGDTLTFTYSQPINPATVTAGWNGAALPVTVRLRDGNLLNLGNTGDSVDILRSGSSVALGPVTLNSNYIKSRRTTTLDATMTAGTVTINGSPRTIVTLALGPTTGGAGSLRTASTPAAMVWSPGAAVTGTTGIPSSTAPITEPGALDRDF